MAERTPLFPSTRIPAGITTAVRAEAELAGVSFTTMHRDLLREALAARGGCVRCGLVQTDAMPETAKETGR